MQEAKKQVIAISNYFVSLPHPFKTLLMIVCVSFIFGVLFKIAGQAQVSASGILLAGFDGLFLLAIPSVLSSAGLFLMRRKAIFRRAIFLGLLTVICYGLFYLLAFALSSVWSESKNLVFVGFGFSFVLWYFSLLLAFDFKKSAIIFATMQLVLFAVFFISGQGFVSDAETIGVLAKTYLASFVLLAALYIFFFMISAPMKKNLGVSSTEAISMFFSQWLYGQKDLEDAFDEIGEEVTTLVWVCNFKGKKNNALFVVPYMHFGPFGNLGGSEFTALISSALSKSEGKREIPKDVFVFHGTATHDFNPVSSDEVGNVVSACRRAIGRLKLKSAAMSLSSSRVGTVRARLMRINDSAFISYTRAPRTTEDVCLGLGLALMERAKRYCGSVAVVDEHNAETGDISSVEVGDPIGFEMLEATGNLFRKRKKQESFLFGCASDQPANVPAIGKNGMKLALFSQNGEAYALLLIDSNGIKPAFRGELIELFEELGKECGIPCKGEVMTTDTHQINTIKGVLYPIGTENCGDVMMSARRLFYAAKEKLEEVQFDSADEYFRLKVFGSGQSAEISSTINAVVAVLRIALPLILIASAVLLLWALGRI